VPAALPADKSPWPLVGNSARYAWMAKADAWYSGDPGRLSAVYGDSTVRSSVGGPGTTLNPQGAVQRLIGAVRSRTWSAKSANEADTRRHLPIAEDIARHSARVLFSERLQIRVMGPTHEADGPEGADGEPQWLKGDPTPETLAAQKRLDANLAALEFDSMLLASGEVSSVLGSSAFRIVYDKTARMTRPIIMRQDADSVIPLYSWGQLAGVIFWDVVLKDDNGVVWRHLELHEVGTGRALHGLYKGTGDNLGERQPLDILGPRTPALVALAPALDAEGGLTITNTPDATTATSIPNILPDPQDRKNLAGRSDFTPAVMDLMDAADAVFTQMMDTIDDAKSRIILSKSMLESGGPGGGVSFDLDQRIFVKVKTPPGDGNQAGLPIEKVQFEMHVEEYLRAVDSITRKAVEAAGYNSRSDAGEGGRDVTATEINSDDALSMGTRDAKIRYQQPKLAALLTTYLATDVEAFAPRDPDTNELIQAYPVEVTFPDIIQPTRLELANVAKALKEAGAASVYELVKTVNPEWNDAQINIEVERITTAATTIDPVTFGGAGEGVGAGDGI